MKDKLAVADRLKGRKLGIEPLIEPELDKVGNIAFFWQLRESDNAELLHNILQRGADHLLVFLPLLVIVAKNEDATILEVWS